MNKILTFLLITLVVSGVIVVTALTIKVFNPGIVDNALGNKQSNGSNLTGLKVPFNININDPAIISARIGYVVDGKLANMINSDEGKEIIMTPKLEGMPKIIIKPETEIVYADQSTTKPAKIDDLAIGQKIRVLAIYGLRTKAWNISKITILGSSNVPLLYPE